MNVYGGTALPNRGKAGVFLEVDAVNSHVGSGKTTAMRSFIAGNSGAGIISQAPGAYSAFWGRFSPGFAPVFRRVLQLFGRVLNTSRQLRRAPTLSFHFTAS